MTEHKAVCPLCGGERESGRTTFAVDLGFGIVVVREVPALVCSQCGDAWIEDPIASRLEELVQEARRKQTVIEVASWQQIAA